jgi:hypothetical protein
MIDLGEGSYPVFFDENADELQDIVAGSFGYFESAGNYRSQLMLLRNTGNTKEPEFEVIDPDYADLGKFGFEGIYPAFGDMDDDGDQDMIIADEEGRLHLFTNEAGPGNQAQFVLTQANYQGIDVGESAKPQIYDVNRDNLPDLLLGERNGILKYYENIGTPTDAVFSSDPTIDEFGGIDVLPQGFTGYSSPFMTTDSLGNYILYVGSEQGYLYLFDNIDDNLGGNFNLVDSLNLFGVNVNVNGSDINGDGRQEFVYGEFAGGLGLLKYGIPPTFGLQESHHSGHRIKLYPNPAKDHLYLDLSEEDYGGPVWVSLIDLQGKQLFVKEFQSTKKTISFAVDHLPSGVYMVQLRSGKYFAVGKFVR